jgi:preprotein translocase subunit SecG
MLIIAIISIIATVLLTAAILLQNPKSGGAGPMMGGGAQFMGHQRTTDILEKATWVGISVLFLVCISYGIFDNGNESAESKSANIEKARKEKVANPTPQAPAPKQ